MEMVVAGAAEKGEGELLFNEYRVSVLQKLKKVLEIQMMIIVAQQCECI